MSLLKEIDEKSRLRPLELYIEEVEDLGINPNHDDIVYNLSQMINEMFGKGEHQASMDLMRGRGIDVDRMNREKVARSGLDNPRLGLQKNVPEAGQYVKLAGGGGTGKVVGVKGDAVRIRNKDGYEMDTPLSSLKPHMTKHPKTGEPMQVWVEMM